MKVPASARTVLRTIALVSLASAATFVSAQAPGGAAPLALTVGDKALKWGPCPEFLPKGCKIAVLQGDPAKNNADVFFQVPGKSKIASHWHTSAERMVLVTGQLKVTYEGAKPAMLKTGAYAYGPAKLAHDAECVSATPCTLFIAFESPVDALPVEAKK